MSGETFVFQYEGLEKTRLDKFLVVSLPEHSRSRLQALIKEGHTIVGGEVVTKAGFILESGDEVRIAVPEVVSTDLIPEDIPLTIVYEDDNLMVVNKPAGMVVHPAAGHSTGTLVHAALAHAPQMEGIGGEQRPGIVHRLDKDTSGLILLAKNDRAHRWLQDQFRLREVNKVYIALVDGAPPTPTGRIEAAIGRNMSQRKQMAVVPEHKGREAMTEYSTLETLAEHTLVEAHPHTGRTHQIRLHLAFVGCPIVGDTVYGRKKATLPLKRQFLHARRISITLPGETSQRTFEAPLPADLEHALEVARKR